MTAENLFEIPKENQFTLDTSFLDRYRTKEPIWGAIGRVIYLRTYSRTLDDGTQEEFWQTCQRVVEGAYSVLKNQIKKAHSRWDENEAQVKAQDMYERMFAFKFLPPGRGLWAMGTKIISKIGGAAVNNCGFVSTKDIDQHFSQPFCDLADFLMVGVGMGFDVRGAGKRKILRPETPEGTFVVEDSREGWIALLRITLDAYVHAGRLPAVVDYTRVRPEGTPLKTFGGVASGYKPLEELRISLIDLLDAQVGCDVSASTITDIMNMIGRCVVSGNVRRSSEIALGDITDFTFTKLKDPTPKKLLKAQQREILLRNEEFSKYDWAIEDIKKERKAYSVLDPEYLKLSDDIDAYKKICDRIFWSTDEVVDLQAKINALPQERWRWASNNSVFAEAGESIPSEVVDSTVKNGEPGYVWLDVMRNYGRLADPPTDVDQDTMGCNPCQPADALILTPDGIRRFSDIEIGSIVWSGSRWTRVINKVATGVKPVYRYRTTAGSFLGTENHRVVSNGVKVEVSEVDSIDLSLGSVPFASEVSPQDILDGLLLGDGMWHGASNRNFLCQGENDECYDTSEISHLLGESSVYAEKTLRRIHSTIVTPLPRTYEREIPARFLFGTPTTVRGFLRGLYTANGSICGGRVTLKAASRSVIDSAQAMLSSLGIPSYVTTNAEHNITFNNGEYTCKESYDLNIANKLGRLLFQRLIGFIHPHKNERLQATLEGSRVTPKPKMNFDVVEIEALGDMPVFDITVDAEEHTYWTNGLLVSNCGEQQLHNMELCCLVETFPTNHDSLEDFLATLKVAYLYGKIVTLIPTHNEATNAVMMANRRIGLSMAGIAEMYDVLGLQECIRWWDTGYKFINALDKTYSGWMGVPRSIKKTSVKPGGTTPLLAGKEGGMKWPVGKHYIRTVRMDHLSPLAAALKAAGYRVEPDRVAPRTVVVYFPVKLADGVRSDSEVSLWEKAALFTALQRYWSDNMVSATLTFQKHEEEDVGRVLEVYSGQWKGVSFLPMLDHDFAQPPYSTIPANKYEELASSLKPLSEVFGKVHDKEDKFCDGDRCVIG